MIFSAQTKSEAILVIRYPMLCLSFLLFFRNKPNLEKNILLIWSSIFLTIWLQIQEFLAPNFLQKRIL